MKYKMVAFSLNTLVKFGESSNPWDFVRTLYNIHDYWKGYLSGKISIQEAKTEEFKAWKKAGIKKDRLMMDLKKNMKFIEGAKEVFQKIKSEKSIPVIASESPLFVVENVATILGAKHISGITLFFDKDGYAYDAAPTHKSPEDRVSKLLALKDFAKKENIKLKDIAIVTNNTEDSSLFKLIGLSLAFNSQSSELKRAANLSFHSKDLSEILEYL